MFVLFSLNVADICISDLDFYQSIKLVNYIRAAVKEGNLKPDVASATTFADDKYLQPVLEDDALLFSLDEIASSTTDLTAPQEQTPEACIADLEAQLTALHAQFADFRLQVDQTLEKRWTDTDQPAIAESSSTSAGKKAGIDNTYFESYSYNAIHEEMLKDTIRTDAYRDFIYDNKHLFAGKTVLDVGCGTGILSMFCAKAGAAKVIAVDNSDIIDKARANVFANKLDGVITCLRGKIEEINIPVQNVDIIVSEWMGYCLLFEAMLDSVLWARDRYLKPDGLMVPSHTVLHIAPISDESFVEENIEFWRDVYGFNMTAMQEKICEDVLVRHLPTSSVAGATHPFFIMDLHRIKVEDLVFSKPLETELLRDVDSLDGWLLYFDTFFLTSRDEALPAGGKVDYEAQKKGQKPVAFTTGPHGKETHWKAGVLLVERSKVASGTVAKGTKVKGSITYRKAKDKDEGVDTRGLEIDIDWQIGESTTAKQSWYLK